MHLPVLCITAIVLCHNSRATDIPHRGLDRAQTNLKTPEHIMSVKLVVGQLLLCGARAWESGHVLLACCQMLLQIGWVCAQTQSLKQHCCWHCFEDSVEHRPRPSTASFGIRRAVQEGLTASQACCTNISAAARLVFVQRRKPGMPNA